MPQWWIRHSIFPSTVVMVGTWMRKANLYPEYVYIPLRTNLCLLHMEKAQPSMCHLVSGWSLQRTFSIQEFNADVYCCQAPGTRVIQVSLAERAPMLLSLYVASPLPLCPWVQWAITWVAEKKADTHRACHFVCPVIMSLLCSEYTVGHSKEAQISSKSLPIPKGLSAYSFPSLPCYQSSAGLFKAWSLSQTVHSSLQITVHPYCSPITNSRQTTECTPCSLTQQENFPWPLSFRATLLWVCITTTVHFQMVPTYHGAHL